MAHVEEILQLGPEQVGLSEFKDFEVHGGLFVFDIRVPILTSGTEHTSRRTAIPAINSICCAKVALGPHRADQSDPY